MNEELAAVFTRCFSMELLGMRYFNVHGPRQDPDGPYAAVLPRFFRAYLRGESPVIYGDGEQSRDFTYVSDAVRTNLLAAGAPAESCGRAYNVAGGRRVTVIELCDAVRRQFGGGPDPERTADRPGDVKHSLADLSRSRGALDHEPALDLDAGLAVAREYYASVLSVAGSTAHVRAD